MPRIPYSINDWNLPPVGVLYISSYMKTKKLPVFNLNLNIEEGNLYDIMKTAILENDIDIISVGGLIVNYSSIKEIIDISKKIKPEVVTIIGGGLVTHSPIEAMNIINNADYGVIGEGEITIVELTMALSKNAPINDIDGLIYREKSNRELFMTDKRREVEDLDNLPWPDYEGFQYFEISRIFSSSNKLTAPVTTSRSCPYRCTFCSKSGGERYRKRSIESVLNEIDYLSEKYGVSEVFLNDELFADDLIRVSQFCEAISKRRISWHIMLRVSKKITKELLLKMKSSGCLGICYGMESADNTILKSMHKGITIEEIYRVIKLTHEANLTIRGGFIFGDSLETLETANKTLSWIESNLNILGNISISPIILYPGSQLYKKAISDKKISNSQQFILDECKPVNISLMTDQEYYKLINVTLPKFSSMIRYKKSVARQEELKEILIAHESEGFYSHEFICDKCGARIVHKIYPASLFQSHVFCVACSKNYDFTPSFLYFETFEEIITSILKRKNLAVWGAGETLTNLLQCNNYFRSRNDLIIVDLDENKQKTGFFDKPVYGMSIIEERQISDVLCCTGNVAYFSVKDTILKNYGEKVNIMWINEVGLIS